MFTTAHSAHVAPCKDIKRSPSSCGHGHSWHRSELQGEAFSAVELHSCQVLPLMGLMFEKSVVLPSSEVWDITVVQLIFVGGVAAPTFLLQWQVGLCHLSQALYQSCGPPPALEFMVSCRGRKSVWWMCLLTPLLLQLFFFFGGGALGSPSPHYLVLLRQAASPLLQITWAVSDSWEGAGSGGCGFWSIITSWCPIHFVKVSTSRSTLASLPCACDLLIAIFPPKSQTESPDV